MKLTLFQGWTGIEMTFSNHLTSISRCLPGRIAVVARYSILESRKFLKLKKPVFRFNRFFSVRFTGFNFNQNRPSLVDTITTDCDLQEITHMKNYKQNFDVWVKALHRLPDEWPSLETWKFCLYFSGSWISRNLLFNLSQTCWFLNVPNRLLLWQSRSLHCPSTSWWPGHSWPSVIR
jgi:hypothetical protein